ncbi:MAG: YgjV family protein [Firmicutes bacterium]|nr:YgjV family protein [Bacillota bacterium]
MEISAWFIIAQIFGVIAMSFEFASYQIKDKRKYLLVNGIGGIFWTLMFVGMGLSSSMATQLSLIIVGMYTTTRALVFWWIFAKDTPARRKGGRIFLLVMLTIALSAGIFIITGLPTAQVQILQATVLVFALAFVIGQYMPGKHPVRITVFLYAIMLFLTQTPLNIIEGYGIERWNIMGMLIETAKMLSVIVFYFFFFQKKVLAKKLVKIKNVIDCELVKINSDIDKAILAETGIMKLSELEKLAAKMVRMELKCIETDEITNVGTSESQTQAIMDDLKTVHDVKMLLERAIKAKMNRLKKMEVVKNV